MSTRNKSFFTNPLIVVALGAAMSFAVACGDDDDSANPAPAGGTKNTGGTNSTAGKTNTGGTNSTAGKTNNMAGTPEQTGGGGAGPGPDLGGAGAGGMPDCTDEADKGCYSCKPQTMDQYLNQCPTTGCEPFDNTTLTSFVGGKLPKLP